MSAPRTMSEQQEREDRENVKHYLKMRSVFVSLSGTDTDGERAFRAWAELDALRAAFTALEQEYAQAVRALRACDMWVDSPSDDFKALQAVLSTPRAQAVKEVE